jgi:uncharacterized membrane protein SpoIIM required for sporulation
MLSHVFGFLNPRATNRKPWQMFFIGLIYASAAVLIANWVFSGDSVLSQYSGMIIVTFTVMLSFPFMYFLMRQEESDDEQIDSFMGVWQAHKDAIHAFIWLFLGFVIAFAFWNVVLGEAELFDAQIRTYCRINSPGNLENCVNDYTSTSKSVTGSASSGLRFLAILENNTYVMVASLIFSLIFGVGAIFILAWNASVISTAIGVFTKFSLAGLPLGLWRYMIHGIPEILAYFTTGLAGGIIGVAVIKYGFRDRRSLKIIKNAILLLFIALIFIIVGAFIEVYITPKILFRP